MRLLILLSAFLISSVGFAQSGFKLRVSVADANGKSVVNPEVELLNIVAAPQLNTNGSAYFDGLSKGQYEIKISAPGFSTYWEKFEISQNTEKKIVLQSAVTQLDAVIVRADKTESNVFKTAASVTSISSKQIKDRRIWDINDISGQVPNLFLSNSGDNRNIAGLRGIVTTSYEQAVATYVDGVAQFSLDTYIPQLNDIESIDIIRGAQGTLYGRNAMGGVINITTKKPSNKTSLNVNVNVGNYGQLRSSASLKTPLIKNKLFFGLSLLQDKRNGYFNNTFTSGRYDDQQQKMIASQLKYLLGSGWSVEADVKLYDATNDGAFPLAGTPGDALENPYSLSQNLTAQMKDKTSNASVVIRHKGVKTDLTIQSARQRNYRYYTNTLDADFSPADIVGIFNNYGKDFNNVNVVSNEVRWSSSKQNSSKLQWTIGAFQFIQDNPTKQATAFGKDAGLFGVPDTDFALISTNIGLNTGIAGFANAGWKLTDKFQINAGLRLDNESRKLTVGSAYEKQPDPAFPLAADTTGKSSYSAFSPKIGIQYTLNENGLFYINYNRGFRSGGLTGISSDPSQIPLASFDPEFSNMFEAGIKGSNPNSKFQYGIVVFLNQVNNIQTPTLILPDAITVTKNSGKLRSSGVELELAAKPIKGITLQYAGGITNAKYSDFSTVNDGSNLDLSGKRQIYTPQSTHYLSAQYQRQLGKNDIMARLEYNRVGKQYFDFKNDISQAAYGLLNIKIAYSLKQWELSAWGRNLGGVKYIDYAYDFGAAHLGEPQTWGVGLGFRL
jgi:iron complex outermembrane recepter protein